MSSAHSARVKNSRAARVLRTSQDDLAAAGTPTLIGVGKVVALHPWGPGLEIHLAVGEARVLLRSTRELAHLEATYPDGSSPELDRRMLFRARPIAVRDGAIEVGSLFNEGEPPQIADTMTLVFEEWTDDGRAHSGRLTLTPTTIVPGTEKARITGIHEDRLRLAALPQFN